MKNISGVFLLILFMLPIEGMAQWEMKWRSTKPSDVSLGPNFLIGQMDDDPQKEIVWLNGEKGANQQILVLDGLTGEAECVSDPYFKIFSSATLEDIDNDGRAEVVFTAQRSATSAITMGVMEYSGSGYVAQETPPPSWPQSGYDTSNRPNGEAKTAKEEPQAPAPAPSTPPATTGKEEVAPSGAADIPPANSMTQLPPEVKDTPRKATVNYYLPSKGEIKVEIFSGTGQFVRTLVEKEATAGTYEAVWDGKNEDGTEMNTGYYFYKVTVNRVPQERKSIYLR